MPLLRIEPILNAELGIGPWAAVLFTSANAVRAVAAHRRFGELADLPVYTVGRRTQAAAAAAGFASIMSADGDANALVSLIASRAPVASLPLSGASLCADRATSSSPPPCGEVSRIEVGEWGTSAPQRPDSPGSFGHSIEPSKSATADFDGGEGAAEARSQRALARVSHPLLYCAGEDRTGDLAGVLESHGMCVETALVYRAATVAELTSDVRAAFVSGTIDAVLHYSARTAMAFVAAATMTGIRDLSIQTRHLCLSAQVAAPLAAAGAKAIEVASKPNEQALLALVGPDVTPTLPSPASGGG